MTYEIFAQEICLCSLWWNVFLLWKAVNCWIRRSLFPIWHGNIWSFSIPKSMMVFIPNRKGQKVTSVCYLQPINTKIMCHCLSRSFFFFFFWYLILSNFNNCWILCTFTIKRFHTVCWFPIGSAFQR